MVRCIDLSRRAAMVFGGGALLSAGAAFAQAPKAGAPAADPPERKPDLADFLAGTWSGDVISDSKGSSRSGVTLTLVRTGPNTVRITSDYPRLPVITVPLETVMTTIQAARGDSVFLYDRAKASLDVSFNMEVSWSGRKR